MPRLRTGSGIGPNGYVRVRKHCRILQHLPFLPASSLPCCIIATRFFFFLTPNFLYTQRIAGRDSDDIYREFSSDVCKLRMLHCEVEGGMSEYEITGCLRAQRELRRTDSTSPWQHSSTRQVAVHGAESKPASGRKQRGRDAGALRSADKESQLYPHGLMLLIL